MIPSTVRELFDDVQYIFDTPLTFDLQMTDNSYHQKYNQTAEIIITVNKIDEKINVAITRIYGGIVSSYSPLFGTSHEEQTVDGEVDYLIASYDPNDYIGVEGWQRELVNRIEEDLYKKKIGLPIINSKGNSGTYESKIYKATHLG